MKSILLLTTLVVNQIRAGHIKSVDRSISLIEADLTTFTSDIKFVPSNDADNVFKYTIAKDFESNLV